jgi:hypothetical protein
MGSSSRRIARRHAAIALSLVVASGSQSAAAPPTTEDCRAAAREAVAPAQEFIDRYDELTIDEWNALDPPPDLGELQREIERRIQAIVEGGCAVTVVDVEVEVAYDSLHGEGDVGAAIAAVLRGDEPPTQSGRRREPSSAFVRPGDDIAAVLARVGDGSRVRFAAGTYDIEETIVVDVSLDLVGAGLGETTIWSSAPGLAMAFVGPGELTLSDLSLRHAGDEAASVLLAIEGGVTLNSVEIAGGAAESGDGGHGVVFAFEDLEGFPTRTTEQRAGELVVEDSIVTGNAAAGILVTGDASPRIDATTVGNNGRCGVCYSGDAGGTLRNSTIEGNGEIGVQAVGSSHPSIEANTIRGLDVGVLAGGDAAAVVAGNVLVENDIALRGVGAADLDVRGNRVGAAEIAGISLIESSTGTLHGNRVETEAPVGVEVAGNSSVIVDGNVIDGTGQVGLSFIGSSSGRASANVITERDVGIQVGGTAAPVVSDNQLRGNRRVGMLFAEQAAGSAIGNIMSQLVGSAIEVIDSASPAINANELRGSDFGLVYVDSAGGSAKDNRLLNHRVGIQVQGTATPRLIDNSFYAVEAAAIVFAETASGEASGNECTGDQVATLIAIAVTASPSIGENGCEIVEAS